MMIKGGALLKAVGASVVIALIFIALNYGVATAFGYPPTRVPSQEEALEMMNSPYYGISIIMSCVSYLLYLVYGALYGVFASREGGEPHAGHYALGGGITGIAVMILSSLIGLLVAGGVIAQAMQQIQNTPGIDPETAAAMGPIMLVGAAFGVCIAFGIGGGLAAAGGAIYGAIARSRAIQNPPPA